jgi:hypothetical protein
MFGLGVCLRGGGCVLFEIGRFGGSKKGGDEEVTREVTRLVPVSWARAAEQWS